MRPTLPVGVPHPRFRGWDGLESSDLSRTVPRRCSRHVGDRPHRRDVYRSVTPMTPVVARLAPQDLAVELERAARGLRGARSRTGLSEEEVVSILARQGVALAVVDLRRAESTGVIGLALAGRLAD